MSDADCSPIEKQWKKNERNKKKLLEEIYRENSEILQNVFFLSFLESNKLYVRNKTKNTVRFAFSFLLNYRLLVRYRNVIEKERERERERVEII